MSELLFEPKNSLIKQSIQAHESEEPLNGDGFGIGWYAVHTDPSPGVFVSVRPAWNERNLRYIAPKIYSHCFMAHVRAASQGAVSEANCHPFHAGNFLFMHNGDIGNFGMIKRRLADQLSEAAYNSIQGQTDSEHFFALFMDVYHREPKHPEDVQAIAFALEETILQLREIKKACNCHAPDYINAVITNGKSMVGIRYVSDKRFKPPSMYVSEGKTYTCEKGVCRMIESAEKNAVLIVSERLTDIESDWHVLPVNHLVMIDSSLGRHVRKSVDAG